MSYQLLQAKTYIYSVVAIDCPLMADWFMQKYVALILPECNVVLSYCIVHWCLVKKWCCATSNLNAINCFDVLLTVHLSIFISVINQLDAQNFYITISFISRLYMFRAHVLIIRRSKLRYTASGIITPIGGRLVQSSQVLDRPLLLPAASLARLVAGSNIGLTLYVQF